MHSHPHRLTHPHKRGCVVYSKQLGRMAKLWILCRPEEKSVFVRLLQSIFYHTPLRGRSGIHRRTEAKESLHRLAVLLQMLSPLVRWWGLFFFFVCVGIVFLKRSSLTPRLFIFVNCTRGYLWMNEAMFATLGRQYKGLIRRCRRTLQF